VKTITIIGDPTFRKQIYKVAQTLTINGNMVYLTNIHIAGRVLTNKERAKLLDVQYNKISACDEIWVVGPLKRVWGPKLTAQVEFAKVLNKKITYYIQE
jgi:hypothetical protein